MRMKRLLLMTFAVAMILQFGYVSELPETVASHFGSGGNANGWMSKQAYLVFSLGLFSFINAIFLLIPVIFRKTPVKYINFPNKTYWLAEHRKQQSIVLMSNWIQFIGVLTNVFMIAVFHLAYLANQANPKRLDEHTFLILMIVYISVFILWLIMLYRRFRVGPERD